MPLGAVLWADENELRRGLARAGHGSLALAHGHRAERVRQLGLPEENDQGRGPVVLDTQVPVGAADRGRRGRGVDTNLAGLGTGPHARPEAATPETQSCLTAARCRPDAPDHQVGIPVNPNLRGVLEQDGESAVGAGVEAVAGRQVLLGLGRPKGGVVDEPHLLVALHRDDLSHRRRPAGDDGPGGRGDG